MCAILCFGRNNANPIFRTNNSVNKTPTDPKVKYMKAGGNGDNPIQRKLATKIARTTAVILMRRFPDMLNSFMLAHKAELGATENGYSLDSCQLFVTKQRIHSSLKHTIILHIETTNVTGYALRESTGNCSNASPLICDVTCLHKCPLHRIHTRNPQHLHQNWRLHSEMLHNLLHNLPYSSQLEHQKAGSLVQH